MSLFSDINTVCKITIARPNFGVVVVVVVVVCCCAGACQAGEYSKTGLAICEACDVGKYQPNNRQSSCLSCPGSSVTLAKGSKSLAECGSK